MVARAARIFCIASMLVLVSGAAAQADELEPTPDVAAIAMSEFDRTVVDEVERLGVALTRVELDAATTDVAVLVGAGTLPQPLVLWVDSGRSTVSVMRTADGTALSRVLAPKTFSETPYVAALAASELIELMQSTPATRVETPRPTADDLEGPAPGSVWGASAFAGAELAAGPRRGLALFRPVLGVDVLYRLSGLLFADVGLVAMPYGVVAEPLPREGGRIRYRRTDLALRLGVGVERGSASFGAHLLPGLGFLSVEAEGIEEERAREKRRRQLFAGGGLVFRNYVWERVGVTFGIDVLWLTSPARYLVDGALALEEDSLRISASLSLLVRLR
jgi:hypothetical protein